MCIHLFLTAIMEAALMVIRTDKYNSLSYRVFISIIRPTQPVFERKILRRIFGPTKENQIWRIKTNEELDKLIKHKNIVIYIKVQRLS